MGAISISDVFLLYNVSGELPLVLPLAPYFLWEIAGEELTRRKFIVNFAKRTLTQRHVSIQFQSCENFCIKSIDIYIVSNSGASLNWCKLIMFLIMAHNSRQDCWYRFQDFC